MPWYLASGRRMVGMHAGALALCVTSLVVVLAVLSRLAGPAVCLAAATLLGSLVWRASPLAWTFWNPYVVVLPVTVLLVLAAGLASGRWRWLPWLVLVASFLGQTHVSLVPCAAVIVTVACISAFRSTASWRDRSMWQSVALAALTAGVVWALPVVEELTSGPGNLTALTGFFLEPDQSLPWRTALAVWSHHVVAVLLPGFALPSGGVIDPPDIEPWVLIGAVGQLVLLGLVARGAARRNDGVAALALLGMTASLVGLWSITRIRGALTDYAVFWQSAVGALNWAVVIGVGLGRVWPLARVVPHRSRLAHVFSGVVVLAVGVSGAAGIRAVIAETGNPNETAQQVRNLADLIQHRLSDMGARSVVLHVSIPVWVESAGVILQLRKRGVPVTVAGDLAFVFVLPPDGTEDAAFEITHHRRLAVPDGATEVGRVGEIVVAIPARPK